jgi:transcriptional regulator with XRE-family HTH domain
VIELSQKVVKNMSRSDKIANRIKTMRLSRGISQNDLAIELQCAQSTIAMYETGKRTPDLDTIDHLADIFNVPPYDIIYSEDEIKSMIATNNLSLDERRLIAAYRSAPEVLQHAALQMLESNPAEKKKNRA